jgi:hypothetical protein
MVKFIVIASLLALLTYALTYEIPTKLYLKNALKGKFEYINANELKSNKKQKKENPKKEKKEKQQKDKKKIR